MMNKMIVANLVHRPIRSLISVVAIALEVTLILLIVWLSLGMLNDSRERQAGIGADVIVLPPGSSNIMGVTGAAAPIKVADIIRKLPHVTVVSPVVMQISTAGNIEVLYGIDLKSFEALGGPFRYLRGGPFQGSYDVLVDDFFAQSRHVKAGETIEILNNRFRIAGVVEHGKGARRFLPIQTLQDLSGAQGRASAFYLKLDSPDNADRVVNEIKQVPGMQQYVVRSMREYLSMMNPSNVPMLSVFIRIVIGISVTIGFIVIFQAMYTAVMERTREIGILKSMGASKLYIVNVILRETVLLALAGVASGVAVSIAARAGLGERIPTLPIDLNWGWVGKATVIAIVGAIAGAVYPAFKAAQKDPIDALAYE
jgi:putative ABC transport system permease protein